MREKRNGLRGDAKIETCSSWFQQDFRGLARSLFVVAKPWPEDRAGRVNFARGAALRTAALTLSGGLNEQKAAQRVLLAPRIDGLEKDFHGGRAVLTVYPLEMHRTPSYRGESSSIQAQKLVPL
jgi:hypothetical protein